jgi:hypothetical protein
MSSVGWERDIISVSGMGKMRMSFTEHDLITIKGFRFRVNDVHSMDQFEYSKCSQRIVI